MTNTMTNTTSPRTIGHTILTLTRLLLLGLAGCIFIPGCGPTFDPASLIETTRVLGARVEVEGSPERATPTPGETADVTWLATSPGATPPLGWTFVVCLPATVDGKRSLGCPDAPLARFDGTTSPPRISIPVPSEAGLGGAASIIVYGRICAGIDSIPTFDMHSGLPGCTGGSGTTVSLDIPLQRGEGANHNPIADRAFTFDGEVWPAGAAGDDPCVLGPRIVAGSKGHVIGNTTEGSDRELYALLAGDPSAATQARETLEISQFTTAGELKSQFSFVEATDESATTTVDVTWEAPPAGEVAAGGTSVTFTFVVRDDRGGADWTTRVACVFGSF